VVRTTLTMQHFIPSPDVAVVLDAALDAALEILRKYPDYYYPHELERIRKDRRRGTAGWPRNFRRAS